jgi:TRAP-type transport system small permease protein
MKRYDDILENFVCVIYVLLIIVSGLQVFSRYILNHSFPWTEEIGRYSFVYLTFIGAALCIRNEVNINLDLLTKRLPKSASAVLEMAVEISIILFLLLLIYQGALICQKTARQVSAALRLPMVIFYISIPLGAIFMLINMVRVFLKHKKQFKQLKG